MTEYLSQRQLRMLALESQVGVPQERSLLAKVGYDRNAQMGAMAAALAPTVAGQPGVGCGPVTGQGCAPMSYPPQVVQSVMQKQCAGDNPLGMDPNATLTYAQVMALINTSKYATSPARLGWQCDSLTFTQTTPGNAPNINANAAFGPINITPTRSFAADTLVSAAGTSNDPVFFMESLTYDSVNYIDNSPWLSVLYTSQAACCLCVRDLKIIEKNTTVSLSGHNGNTANVLIVVTLFGSTLFAGNP